MRMASGAIQRIHGPPQHGLIRTPAITVGQVAAQPTTRPQDAYWLAGAVITPTYIPATPLVIEVVRPTIRTPGLLPEEPPVLPVTATPEKELPGAADLLTTRTRAGA